MSQPKLQPGALVSHGQFKGSVGVVLQRCQAHGTHEWCYGVHWSYGTPWTEFGGYGKGLWFHENVLQPIVE